MINPITGEKTVKRKLAIISILLFGLTLAGCQTAVTTTHYLGAKVDTKGVINLSAKQAQ